MTSSQQLSGILYLSAALPLSLAASFASAEEPSPQTETHINVIDVVGKRKEAQRPHRAGQNLVIRPAEETRFDTSTHLKGEATLTLPDTGRVNASGFNVPRIRGQDARFTDIFVDDMQLQDPLTGLPVVDDIDLRGFGVLAIYQGNAPVDLPTINAIGALQYKTEPLQRSSVAGGLSYGEPYGAAQWVLGAWRSPPLNDDDSVNLRLYGRSHQTSGRYTYYSDNATPYNTSDDSYQVRRNNHRNSTQMIPSLKLRQGRHRLQMLGVLHDSKAGIPSRLTEQASSAHEDAASILMTGAWEYELGHSSNMLAPDVFGVFASSHDEQRQLHDPAQLILITRRNNTLNLHAQKAGFKLAWYKLADGLPLALHLRADETTATVRTKGDDSYNQKLRRRIKALYLGFEAPLPLNMRLELKSQGSAQQDRTLSASSTEVFRGVATDKELVLTGHSAAISRTFHGTTVYAQGSRWLRGPSLLEEFGNGTSVRESPRLGPEHVTHRELGFLLRFLPSTSPFSGGTIGIGGSLFQDDTNQKIVLLPSVGQSLQAQNTGQTRVRGTEIHVEADLGKYLLQSGFAWLEPHKHGDDASPKLIPGIPERRVTAALGHVWGPSTWRWATRHQSQVYRDISNSIIVPSYTVHDASLDLSLRSYGMGISILNVFDVTKLPISAPSTSQSKGMTSYSDFAGMPLPGRQWRVSIAAKF